MRCLSPRIRKRTPKKEIALMNLAQTIDIRLLTKARASWLAAIAQLSGETALLPEWLPDINSAKKPSVVRLLDDDED